VPGTNEIIYLLSRDSSVIRRIDARPGAKPRDDGSIDGEFNRLAFAPTGGPVLAEVASRDDSFWRIDLHAHEPKFDRLRRLPWNVANLNVSPNGKTVLYTRSTRGRSEFYASDINGAGAKLLFSLPYERVDQSSWSPDRRQIAFTAEPVISRIPPSHLFIASSAGGSPRRLLKQFEYIELINWSRAGKALFLVAGTGQESSIWKLNPADSRLTRILPLSSQFAAQTDGKFIYFRRPPSSLLRVPIDGGEEEPLASGVLNFTVGGDAVYFVRQRANPPTAEGQSLYRLDLATRESKLIDRNTAIWESLQMSPDERFIYGEKHGPTRRDIMVVQNWH
jgi:dipeptidyl aminopeptidase/acylaminoacyl peptidase